MMKLRGAVELTGTITFLFLVTLGRVAYQVAVSHTLHVRIG